MKLVPSESCSKRSPIVQLTEKQEKDLSAPLGQPTTSLLRKSQSDVPLIKLDSQEEQTVLSFDPLNVDSRSCIKGFSDQARAANYRTNQFDSSYISGIATGDGILRSCDSDQPALLHRGTPSDRLSTVSRPQYLQDSHNKVTSVQSLRLPPTPTRSTRIKSPGVNVESSATNSLIDFASTERGVDIFDPLAEPSTSESDHLKGKHSSFYRQMPTQTALTGVSDPVASFHSTVSGQQAVSSSLFKIIQAQPVSQYNAFGSARPAATSVKNANSGQQTLLNHAPCDSPKPFPDMVQHMTKGRVDGPKPDWEKFE